MDVRLLDIHGAGARTSAAGRVAGEVLRDASVMHELLSAALLPVITDLRTTGAPLPEIADEDWMGDPTQASAMLRSPDGSATGVRMSLFAAESDRIAEIADQSRSGQLKNCGAMPARIGHPARSIRTPIR
jgi:hypothetical protein